MSDLQNPAVPNNNPENPNLKENKMDTNEEFRAALVELKGAEYTLQSFRLGGHALVEKCDHEECHAYRFEQGAEVSNEVCCGEYGEDCPHYDAWPCLNRNEITEPDTNQKENVMTCNALTNKGCNVKEVTTVEAQVSSQVAYKSVPQRLVGGRFAPLDIQLCKRHAKVLLSGKPVALKQGIDTSESYDLTDPAQRSLFEVEVLNSDPIHIEKEENDMKKDEGYNLPAGVTDAMVEDAMAHPIKKIRCGNCAKNKVENPSHDSVAEVRACYGAPLPVKKEKGYKYFPRSEKQAAISYAKDTKGVFKSTKDREGWVVFQPKS